jgi:cytochrome bd ubiquinol oxidase subunit II
MGDRWRAADVSRRFFGVHRAGIVHPDRLRPILFVPSRRRNHADAQIHPHGAGGGPGPTGAGDAASVLLPYVAREDIERRVAINAVGPFWDGNQVWLILGGGAVFAAWPPVYAASFSGFYIAMFLVLATLILRPVGFEFRGKISDARWRAFWDYALFAGGLVPSVVFGVAFGNLLQGRSLPDRAAVRPCLRRDACHPWGGLSDAQDGRHGSEACARVHQDGAVLTVALFVVAGLWVWLRIDGYAITSTIVGDGPSNPLMKTVVRRPGQWLANYTTHPWTIAAPCLGIIGPLLALLWTMAQLRGLAFIASALGILGIIATAGVSMFPFLMPSDIAPTVSLTVWDASSRQLTLFVMLLATLIFLPVVLVYTAIVFSVLRGAVTASQIERNTTHLY